MSLGEEQLGEETCFNVPDAIYSRLFKENSHILLIRQKLDNRLPGPHPYPPRPHLRQASLSGAFGGICCSTAPSVETQTASSLAFSPSFFLATCSPGSPGPFSLSLGFDFTLNTCFGYSRVRICILQRRHLEKSETKGDFERSS